MNARKLFYTLPPAMRMLALKLYYGPGDLWEQLTGKRNQLIPPRSMIYTGRGDFISQGKLHLKYLTQLGDTRPEHSVLDIGSGIGRTAVALTDFLSSKASYYGFDTVKSGVEWCQKNISGKFPNFKFEHIPLSNDLYNQHALSASEFEFPYAANFFDRIFAMSVFTHLQPEETANYLLQSARVLKPGGRCVFTFFLYDELIIDNMKSGKTLFNFPFDMVNYRLMDSRVKAANVAYNKAYIFEQLIPEAGLMLVSHLPGYWSGIDKKDVDFQDVIVLEKL
jgi:SAM-dependent methyltransferase